MNDIVGAIMGEKGVDIKLSDKAKKFIPFAIECKNQEAYKKLYKDYNQSSYNSDKNIEPIVILKMNNEKPLVVMDATYFLDRIHE